MADEIPQWAFDRAFKLAAEKGHTDIPCAAIDALALYIFEHEEPPVDPLLIEAREIVAKSDHDPWPESTWHMGQAERVRAGLNDDTLVVRAAYNGLRRGMELAGERS